MTKDAAPQLPVRMTRNMLQNLICELFLDEKNTVQDISKFLQIPDGYVQYVIRKEVHNKSFQPLEPVKSNREDDIEMMWY